MSEFKHLPTWQRWAIWGSLAFVVGLWGAWLWSSLPEPLEHGQVAGTWGDSFGGLTALFSGLAFWGVIAALLLQMQELRLQREEIRDSKTQLRRQADAMEAEHALALERERTASRPSIVTYALRFTTSTARSCLVSAGPSCRKPSSSRRLRWGFLAARVARASSVACSGRFYRSSVL